MKIERLGPYRIERQIGKGGMGAVYVAIFTGPGEASGARVAVKALNPQLAVAEGFRERFEAEIDSLKKLCHEGIVRLYGYGEQEGMLYYSMELVDGTSLEEELHGGRRFDWHETLQLGIQICRALKHAHDHGVVHRDIKPANLLLTKDQKIKIADFGIARLFGSNQLTTAGGVLGTADYMSPEQADGRPVTEKCDQYSLGGVLYALLAGRPPFRAKTMPEMLQMQRFAEPEPVRRYAPGTPDQLDRLILQLLSKEPEARFPNVLVLSRHMEAMEKALSRAEQSSLAGLNSGESNPPKSLGDTSVINEGVTHDELARVMLPHSDPLAGDSIDLFDAPTLAQAEAESRENSGTSASFPGEIKKSTHFTTVAEDARRHQQLEEADSHAAFLARWIALAMLLCTLAWGGWKFSRPTTADDLFQQIESAIEQSGDEDLRIVEDELRDFKLRFPQDPRNQKLSGYLEQLEFQKLQRQARMKSRYADANNVGPLEKIYLEAIASGEDSPEVAQVMLKDLLRLYDPTNVTANGPTDEGKPDQGISAEDQQWLVLSRQELEKLAKEFEKIAAVQLPRLKERMQVAALIAQRNPEQGAEMYRAIVRLYGKEPWASAVIVSAQKALTEITPTVEKSQ